VDSSKAVPNDQWGGRLHFSMALAALFALVVSKEKSE